MTATGGLFLRTVRALPWLIAGAAALYAMQVTRPDYARMTAAARTEVAAGATGIGPAFQAGIGQAFQTKTLRWTGPEGEIRRDTAGTWLVLRLTAEARRQPAALVAVWQGATGRRYGASRRLIGAPQMLGSTLLQPGLPVEGLLAFELPPDEIEGGQLVLSGRLAPLMDRALWFAPLPRPVPQLDAFVLQGETP